MTSDLPKRIYLLSHQVLHTTARYFESIWRNQGIPVYYDQLPHQGEITEDDYIIHMDPAGSRWYEFYHTAPCPTAAYLIDVHLDLEYRLKIAPFFDCLYVAQKDYVHEVKRSMGVPTEWLPFSAVASEKSEIQHLKYEVAFVGQLGEKGTTRREVLETVLNRFQSNEWWKYHSPDQMRAAYSSSKIVINHSVRGDLNMRVFESMGCGALLVTDRIKNGLSELFQEGVHYVGYQTPKEAVDKIKFYIDHEVDRQKIARAGQEEVLSFHTYSQRAEKLIQGWRELRCGERRASIRNCTSGERAVAYGTMAAYHGDFDGWYKYWRERIWDPALGFQGIRAYLRKRRFKQK